MAPVPTQEVGRVFSKSYQKRGARLCVDVSPHAILASPIQRVCNDHR